MQHQRVEPPARLRGLDAARRFFAGSFSDPDRAREELLVAHLDGDTRCVHLARYDGGEAMVAMPVKAILADALAHGSHGVVLAHNHPGGDPVPSKDDCRATRLLVTAAQAIDVTVVDHLVFAGRECSSFRRMGLL